MRKCCKTCLEPISHDDAICFRCLSINSKEPEREGSIEEILADLARSEETLDHTDIFPGLPERHSDKDKS